MFAIQVEFLEGRVIAARPDRPVELEWPLEPARLFMALVAAHFEGNPSEAECDTLQWLESIQPSQIIAPPAAQRNVVTVFVPVNDRVDDPSARSKQPRTFPSAYVGDRPLIYGYDCPLPPEHREPLMSLLAQVVRIGHSASLVRCSLLDEPDLAVVTQRAIAEGATCWRQTAGAGQINHGDDRSGLGGRQQMRVASDGFLARLMHDYNGDAIEQYAELSYAISQAANKKEASAAKKHRDSIYPAPPVSRRPIIGVLASYRHQRAAKQDQATVIQQSTFEPTLIPLAIIEGNSIGLESTLAMTAALRSAILSQYQQDAPAWVCGHEPNGSVTTRSHLALVPLAFVGNRSYVDLDKNGSEPGGAEKAELEAAPSEVKPPARRRQSREYADDHLLGLGIILPKNLTPQDKSSALGKLLFKDDDDHAGQLNSIELRINSVGHWMLQRESRSSPPQTLVPETWSRPSRFWASVTPIVLDRHPKSDRASEPAAWQEEAAEIISIGCERAGLPRPLAVRVLKHGPIAGVPSSRSHRSGFPPLTYGDENKVRRQQTHAVLEFASPVEGPLLVGAGRFRGYGFCKPIEVPS